jgi:hypothetical protein
VIDSKFEEMGAQERGSGRVKSDGM